MKKSDISAPRDFTSKLVDQQTAAGDRIKQEMSEVAGDPSLSLVDKAKNLKILNHKYEVNMMIMKMLVDAENERMKKILQ
jgi:hypothetical protein